MGKCNCSDPNCNGAHKHEDALKTLMEYHDFPCQYMFKIIGFDRDDFVSDVQEACEKIIGPLKPEQQPRCSHSSGKRYCSVTLDIDVLKAEDVLAIYDKLKAIEGVVTLA